MPAQTSDLSSVTTVLGSADGVTETVRTMLLEGLPFAAQEGCSHAYQKEFMNLAGGVLAETRQSVTEQLASMEVETRLAEGELETAKAKEAEIVKAVEEATNGIELVEAEVVEAAKAVKDAEKEHKAVEAESAAFLKQRQEDRQERAQVAAVVEGALRMLVSGGWDDEETKGESVEAVDSLLVDVKADKVLVAAALPALGQKPDSRAKYDSVVVDEVMRVLPAHLSDLDSKLQASEAEEVDKQAEILGLWAIADCARDSSSAAAGELANAQEKQALAEMELKAGQKRAKEQEAAVTERTTKRTRVTERLAAVEEAVGAVTRFASGFDDSIKETALAEAEAEAEAVA